MKNPDAARVWLWAAHWATAEEDRLIYAYPRPDGWEEDAQRFRTIGNACYRQAAKLLGGNVSQEAWEDAIETFSNPDFSR